MLLSILQTSETAVTLSVTFTQQQCGFFLIQRLGQKGKPIVDLEIGIVRPDGYEQYAHMPREGCKPELATIVEMVDQFLNETADGVKLSSGGAIRTRIDLPARYHELFGESLFLEQLFDAEGTPTDMRVGITRNHMEISVLLSRQEGTRILRNLCGQLHDFLRKIDYGK